MKTDLAYFQELYSKTSKEYLERLEKNLTLLSQSHLNPSILEEAHRDAHSLKGQSYAMNYAYIAELCLLLEHFFSEVKKTQIITDETKKTVQEILKKIAVALQDMNETVVAHADEINNYKEILQVTKYYENITHR